MNNKMWVLHITPYDIKLKTIQEVYLQVSPKKEYNANYYSKSKYDLEVNTYQSSLKIQNQKNL